MYNGKSVGCVFLNFNSTEEVIQRINAVQEYEVIDHFVVVDNNSSDKTQHKLLDLASGKVDIILNKVNGGYAAGNNIGINYLRIKYRVDYICIANPDVIFEEDCITRLLSVAEQHPKIGIVSCLIETNSDHKPPAAWRLPDYKRCISESMLICNKLAEKHYLYDCNKPVQEVDVICGAFFIASNDALFDVNDFDERTFLYYEENILAFRLKKKGYSNYLVTDCSVYHEVSASIDKEYNSYIKKAKIMQKSKSVYYRYYLKIHGLKMFMTRVAFGIGVCEVTIYQVLKKVMNSYKSQGKMNV